MERQEIKYKDVMDLGFKEEFSHDQVYFDQYGFDYCIVTKKLTKRIFIDWEKETRLCEMVRVDKNHYIKARKPIMNLKELKEIINFYTDK